MTFRECVKHKLYTLFYRKHSTLQKYTTKYSRPTCTTPGVEMHMLGLHSNVINIQYITVAHEGLTR